MKTAKFIWFQNFLIWAVIRIRKSFLLILLCWNTLSPSQILGESRLTNVNKVTEWINKVVLWISDLGVSRRDRQAEKKDKKETREKRNQVTEWSCMKKRKSEIYTFKELKNHCYPVKRKYLFVHTKHCFEQIIYGT